MLVPSRLRGLEPLLMLLRRAASASSREERLAVASGDTDAAGLPDCALPLLLDSGSDGASSTDSAMMWARRTHPGVNASTLTLLKGSVLA